MSNRHYTETESVNAALVELRGMFPDAKFITISGDYTNRRNRNRD